MTNNFDYKQINEVIHSRIRLAIMAILINVDEAEFVFLKQSVKTTDGNLSIHLKKLEDAGYLNIKKSFLNRKPVSSYRITEKGRQAFEDYVNQLGKFIK